VGRRILVIKANEAAGGFKHASLGWGRLLFRHRPDRFLPRFQQFDLQWSAACEFDGAPAYCHTCGYLRVCITMIDGWTLETCSAMPLLLFDQPQLLQWMKAVPGEKLPTSCV
jgi:hypothetical protein